MSSALVTMQSCTVFQAPSNLIYTFPQSSLSHRQFHPPKKMTVSSWLLFLFCFEAANLFSETEFSLPAIYLAHVHCGNFNQFISQ